MCCVSWPWNEEVHSSIDERMLSKHIWVLQKILIICKFPASNSSLEEHPSTKSPLTIKVYMNS